MYLQDESIILQTATKLIIATILAFSTMAVLYKFAPIDKTDANGNELDPIEYLSNQIKNK